VKLKLGTVQNTALAADLFATMLRPFEMAKQRLAEEKRNGRIDDPIRAAYEQTPGDQT